VPNWLSLDEAAKKLSIHPATLREWADKGQIRTVRTPGGHRRFDEADVLALRSGAKPDLALLMHATVGHTRIAATGGKLASEPWYARFDEAAKARQRELGMDLVQVLVAYLGDAERDWAPDIERLGARYARLAKDAGLSLSDAMRAFHLYEGLVRSSVDELTAARAASADLEQRSGWFLNEVRVAMVESFSREGRP
jgi:excisionase family DNA binding protein